MSQLTIFTCSVYHDVTRLWHSVLQRTILPCLGDSRVLIYDCGSRLDPTRFPGATIIRHRNREHGRKIDHAIRHHIKSGLALILDDDVFPLDAQPLLEQAARMEADANVAAYSFMPRHHWEIKVQGRKHAPMGSYALIVRPELLRAPGMTARSVSIDDPAIRSGSGYFDTLDFANWTWLQGGKDIIIAPEAERELFPTFFGTSSGYMTFSRKRFLRYFRRRCNIPRAEFWKLAREPYTFQRACAVAAVAALYQEVFDEEPFFASVPPLDELRGFAEHTFAGEQLKTVNGALRRTDRVITQLRAALILPEH